MGHPCTISSVHCDGDAENGHYVQWQQLRSCRHCREWSRLCPSVFQFLLVLFEAVSDGVGAWQVVSDPPHFWDLLSPIEMRLHLLMKFLCIVMPSRQYDRYPYWPKILNYGKILSEFLLYLLSRNPFLSFWFRGLCRSTFGVSDLYG